MPHVLKDPEHLTVLTFVHIVVFIGLVRVVAGSVVLVDLKAKISALLVPLQKEPDLAVLRGDVPLVPKIQVLS